MSDQAKRREPGWGRKVRDARRQAELRASQKSSADRDVFRYHRPLAPSGEPVVPPAPTPSADALSPTGPVPRSPSTEIVTPSEKVKQESLCLHALLVNLYEHQSLNKVVFKGQVGMAIVFTPGLEAFHLLFYQPTSKSHVLTVHFDAESAEKLHWMLLPDRFIHLAGPPCHHPLSVKLESDGDVEDVSIRIGCIKEYLSRRNYDKGIIGKQVKMDLRLAGTDAITTVERGDLVLVKYHVYELKLPSAEEWGSDGPPDPEAQGTSTGPEGWFTCRRRLYSSKGYFLMAVSSDTPVSEQQAARESENAVYENDSDFTSYLMRRVLYTNPDDKLTEPSNGKNWRHGGNMMYHMGRNSGGFLESTPPQSLHSALLGTCVPSGLLVDTDVASVHKVCRDQCTCGCLCSLPGQCCGGGCVENDHYFTFARRFTVLQSLYADWLSRSEGRTPHVCANNSSKKDGKKQERKEPERRTLQRFATIPVFLDESTSLWSSACPEGVPTAVKVFLAGVIKAPRAQKEDASLPFGQLTPDIKAQPRSAEPAGDGADTVTERRSSGSAVTAEGKSSSSHHRKHRKHGKRKKDKDRDKDKHRDAGDSGASGDSDNGGSRDAMNDSDVSRMLLALLTSSQQQQQQLRSPQSQSSTSSTHPNISEEQLKQLARRFIETRVKSDTGSDTHHHLRRHKQSSRKKSKHRHGHSTEQKHGAHNHSHARHSSDSAPPAPAERTPPPSSAVAETTRTGRASSLAGLSVEETVRACRARIERVKRAASQRIMELEEQLESAEQEAATLRDSCRQQKEQLRQQKEQLRSAGDGQQQAKMKAKMSKLRAQAADHAMRSQRAVDELREENASLQRSLGSAVARADRMAGKVGVERQEAVRSVLGSVYRALVEQEVFEAGTVYDGKHVLKTLKAVLRQHAPENE